MTKTKLLNALVKKLCAKEKGKKQLNAGQAREVIKAMKGLMQADEDYFFEFFEYLKTK